MPSPALAIFHEAVLHAHGECVRSLARLFSPPKGSTPSDLLAAARKRVSGVIDLLDQLPSGADGHCQAIAYRSVERALALAAVVDSTRRGQGSAPCFEGELRDGYRLLKARFDARPIRWSLLIQPSKDVSPEILAGVVSDNVAVMSELCALVPGNDGFLNSVSSSWIERSTAVDSYFAGSRQNTQAALKVHSRDEFASLLGISASMLSADRKAQRVIHAHDWTGETVYPSIQIKKDGALPKKLDQLNKVLRAERISGWQKAILLAQPWDGDRSVVECLDDDFANVVAYLRRFRVVKDPDTPVKPNYPSSDTLAAAVGKGSHGSVGANEKLYRVVPSAYGPFFFNTATHRFDPPASRAVGGKFEFGSCYLSYDESGAFSETLNRSPIIDLETVLQLSLWEVVPMSPIKNLIDLSAIDGFDQTIVRTLEREYTQQMAALARDAKAMGVAYQLFEGVDGQKGLALFGPEGRSAPESFGHPAMESSPQPLIHSDAFWKWLNSSHDKGNTRFFRDQIPTKIAQK
jgi:hypothetical protein